MRNNLINKGQCDIMGNTKTCKLIKLLGLNPPSTFNERFFLSLSRKELYSLFMYAYINKLGLTFLYSSREYLKRCGYITLYNMYMKLREKYKQFLRSMRMTSDILESLGIEHVFIKTIYGFIFLPSDIDILLLDNHIKEVKKYLRGKGYIEFDTGPHFVSLYNTNIDKDLKRDKTSYDIDLYDEISLSHFIYLDKRLFTKRYSKIKTEEDIMIFPTFHPEEEFIIHINHSLFEHLYTLFHFYGILDLLGKLHETRLNRLIYETNSNFIYRLTIHLTSNILRSCCGSICYNKVIRTNDRRPSPFIIFFPYRYKYTHLFLAIKEKMHNPLYKKSIINLLHSVLNRKYRHHVITELIIRRRRSTY